MARRLSLAANTVLLLLALWLGAASIAHAQSPVQASCRDDYAGVIDGNVVQPEPSNVKIDTNCTIRNYPGGMSTNFSFDNNDPTPYLVIFDNVVHTGQMSCNDPGGHKIWFVNSSSSGIQPQCRDLFIPVEKIDKRSPGQFASIGVPFTYRLTIPVLFDPLGEIVVDDAGSPNDLHSITVTDDLNATGAALTYVSHTAVWEDDGTPVPHSFSNVGGLLTFSGFPLVAAGRQMLIDITVVLEDVPANAPGTQFINTAKWEFGRFIDGVFYQPLPGEWGISQPMTIASPNIVVEKTGTTVLGGTLINLGEWAQFTVDILNNGLTDAWTVHLEDRLPDGPTGGMCDLTPEILSVTLAGTPLAQGTGYSLTYTGPPTCRLTLTLLDAAGPLQPNQHLILTYRTKLDNDTDDGVALTNVAGVTQWSNDASTNADRQTYTRTLTNGTVGTLDHEDAHTLTVQLSGIFFEKTVMNLRSGQDPATVAAPGDTLRYTLRLQTTADALNGFAVRDEIDALNAQAVFVPGSLRLVSPLPAGAVNNSNATGGAKGTGVINISNLNVPANTELLIQFEVRVAIGVAAGTIATNQSRLLVNGSTAMLSDDPHVNGQADPAVAGDEDPTRVLIATPTLLFTKTVLSGATANPGDVVRYRLQLTNVSDVPFSGFSLLDDLDRLNTRAMFVRGTLALVSALPGGATNNSNTNGGSKGTGLIDLRNLSIGVAGSPNQTLTIEFTAQLAPVIANGTIVLDQAQLMAGGSELLRSDDPAISGPQDPTPLVIQSAPLFRVLKTSQDLTGEPNVLRAGDTLRYTITVKNIGNANATDAAIRDQIPANTTYVSGSTRLNGTAVADNGGLSPLVTGMAIHAPEDPTPGHLNANAAATASNVATITFNVRVDPDTADGTVISNQAFVSAVTGGIIDHPSDDPDTPIANDPTRDIVGSLPLLFSDKRAALQIDSGSPGSIDPGDVLRYTITIYNTGSVAATDVSLRDQVPANTTYVANSTTLNGAPYAQPDGGVSPLVGGISVGALAPSTSAVVQFDLRVNDGVAAGTVISNQATVRSVEVPTLLTDGDGNPATGPEPTIVVVGNGQQLSITKQVAVVGGGPATAGGQLEYIVRVTNVSTVPALYVVVTDDLDMNGPGYMTFMDQSATLNGATAGISIAGSVLTADYSGSYGPLAPGATAVVRFRATIGPSLAIGTRITNTAVVTWNDPPQTASASVSIDVGGMVGVGVLNGKAWHDSNFNTISDSNERALEGWTVQLYRNGALLRTAVTDAGGAYRIAGIAPNYATADRYELRFLAPGAGATTAKLGRAHSVFTNDLQRISSIVVQSGSNLQDLNLPISPNGVVYNSIARTPIAGARLTMLRAGAPLPAACFDDPAQQGQVTLANGYYRFDLNFSDPACPSGADYLLETSAPPLGFIAGQSEIIPPTSGAATAAFSVPSCPASADDAIVATARHCEVQTSEFAPPVTVRARTDGTRYHVHLLWDDTQAPGSSQIFNNHIPLDPDLQGVLSMTKTTPLLNVSRGQLVPYVITYTNLTQVPLFDVSIVDRFPAGFRYVEGSARIDDVPAEPAVAGRELIWRDLSVDGSARHTLIMLLAVGSGVSEGEFVNRAQAAHQLTGNALSNEASARVRIVPDPDFDCTDVTGKVFDDANRNGLQDPGERGLPGVRVGTARGLMATTDAYGRYHITCAVTPREGRGSNFVLKLDDRTLPSGFRLSTDEVHVLRATRGKVLRFNFAASIHRVIGLDVADEVFEPGTTQMRMQWRPRLSLLLTELKKAPAVLRVSYLADVEDADLVERRLNAVKSEIAQSWRELDCCYRLTVETQVFWRRGGPPQQADVRTPGSR
jgi:large repetitive protein